MLTDVRTPFLGTPLVPLHQHSPANIDECVDDNVAFMMTSVVLCSEGLCTGIPELAAPRTSTETGWGAAHIHMKPTFVSDHEVFIKRET